MNLSGVLHWWNLVFVLPIALAVLLLFMSALGGLGGTDAHGDADAHGDVDGDADADAHAVGDADHPLFDALHWIGVGAVPLSLLAVAFLLFFGVFGLAVNRALHTAANPNTLIWPALILSALGGLGAAGGFGAVARRFFPTEEKALGNKDLLGHTGRVVFTVTETEGLAQVRDAVGTLHQIPVRVPAGHAPVASGQEILVTSYDADAGAFLVDENPFTLTQEELRRSA